MIGLNSAVTVFRRFVRKKTQNGRQQREVGDGDDEKSLVDRADVSQNQLNRVKMTESTSHRLLLHENLASNCKNRQIRQKDDGDRNEAVNQNEYRQRSCRQLVLFAVNRQRWMALVAKSRARHEHGVEPR